VGVHDHVGVCERARLHGKPGGLECAKTRRHHTAVRRDRDEVQEPAERHHPDEAQVQVPKHERGRQPVRQKMYDAVHGRVSRRHHGHDQHLHAERHHDKPDRAQLDF